MKNQVIIIVFFLLPTILLSQTVEVLGKLKVSQMDTSNTENHLVVKQADGTLATRLVATLPPGPQGPIGPQGQVGATGATGPAGTYTAGAGIALANG